MTPLGFSGRDMLAALERSTAPWPPIVLHWELHAVAGDTELELEPLDHASSESFTDDSDEGCNAVGFDMSMRARTVDGQFEAVLPGRLWGGPTGFQFVGRLDLRERAEGTSVLPDELAAAAQNGTLAELDMVVDGAVTEVSIPSVKLLGVLVGTEGEQLASFKRDNEPHEREHDVYAPPAELVALCAQAQATAPIATTDPTAVAAMIRGSWVLCSGARSRPIDHAGLELGEDGRWKHLSEHDGALSEQLGFGHEGSFDVANVAGVDPSGRPVLRLHGSEPLGTTLSTLELAADGRTLHLLSDQSVQLSPDYYEFYREDYVYVRSDEPMIAAEPARARGERAGSAACAEGEAYVRDQYGSVDELRAAIVGAWALCDGDLGPDATGIVFSADGGYRYLAADGSALGGGRYTISDHTDTQALALVNPALAGPAYSIELYADGNPGPESIVPAMPPPPPPPSDKPRAVPAPNVPKPDHWYVVPLASDAPRKLLLQTTLPVESLYPGFVSYPLPSALLSALPE